MIASEPLTIAEVSAARLHELRRRVLRSDDPTATVSDMRDESDGALHFGGFRGERVVAACSFYPAPAQVNTHLASAQLRYMAVDASEQGLGVGSALLRAAETRLTSRGIAQLWANGRDSALGFYRARGWLLVPGSEHLSAETQLAHTVIYKVLRRDDPFSISWATPDDAAALAAIRAEMHLSLSLTLVNNGWLESATVYFRRSLASADDIAAVARLDDGTVISAAVATFRTVPPSPRFPVGQSAYVHSVGTLPSFRRRGASRQVLALLIDELRIRGVERVELHATDQGEPIYVDLGFVRHDRPEMRLMVADPVPEIDHRLH